ncbi:hypothetical protein [Methylovirgula sp. 4M-Z18]|uniref:hypothetical protein n=1 Tax=Methylovirgula sp. 4M-Z18 TaxID=2293567 RepID=UPI000E2E8AC0|nr:hypothetical protein [Methylovirgula sp. 4M-Z18]
MILAVLFVAVSVAMFWWTARPQRNLFAAGCDDFGYLRQAQLFDTFGPIGGLATRIQAPEALFLTDVAKSITSDSKEWFQLIAPHCHHYVSATDAIILQYPPGTGFLISLFPKSAQYSYLYVSAILLIALTFSWAVFNSRGHFLPWLLAVTALPLIDWTIAQDATQPSSPSHPLTIMCLPILIVLTMRAFPADRAARPGTAFWVGVLGGLLFTIRLPNLFLLAGLLVVPLFNCLRTARRELVWAYAAGLCGFGLSGAAPVMAANWMNAGSPFATTYANNDAAVPQIDLALLWGHLRYYFSGRPTSLTSVAAVCALVIRLATRRHLVPVEGRFGISIGVTIAFGLSLVFFLTHEVAEPYYMMPASIFLLSGVVFELLNIEAQPKVASLRNWAVFLFIPLVASGGLRIAHLKPFRPINTLPDEVLRKDAIVWADINNGTSYYYLQKYAAKFVMASQCMQDKMVQKVSEFGRDQFFIADSDEMAGKIDRYSRLLNMRKIGEFDIGKPLPIFKLPAGTQWPVKICSES